MMECANCGTQFLYRENLVRHLKRFNGVKCVKRSSRTPKQLDFDPERKTFNSETDFFAWKVEMERKTCSEFVPKRGDYVTYACTTKYFCCNRSGFFRERVKNRRRRLKSQGTKKINGTCPAYITIKIDNLGRVTADYLLVHSHTMEPQHLRLQKHVKDEIAAKLKVGVPKEKILNDVRVSFVTDGDTFDRASMIRRKDLQNIARDYKIENQAPNYSIYMANLDLWVQEKFEGKENPVLYFKQQGDLDPFGLLADDDFAVVIMTTFQNEMLDFIGGDEIAVDGILATNSQGFHLISLLTIDESGKAFPFAFCVSNQNTQFLYALFFRALKEHVGDMRCTIFMCDDDSAPYDSWCEVMPEKPRHRYLFTWRVLENWKKNLSSVPLSERLRISRTLRTLLKEKNVDKFETTLYNFVQDLRRKPDLKQFHDYFTSSYVDQAKCWALCYRNHVNNLETMHRVLKNVCLDGATNRELYPTLDAAIALIRDSIYPHKLTITEAMRSRFNERIRESHLSSSSFVLSSLVVVTDSKWEVTFENTDGETYTIEKRDDRGAAKCCCKIECDLCGVCIHAFLCSCYDNAIAVNICEHVHALNSLQSSSVTTGPDDECIVNEIEIDYDYDHADADQKNDVLHFTNVVLSPQAKIERDGCESIALKMERFMSIYRDVSPTVSEEDKVDIDRYLDQMLAICYKYCDTT